MANQVVESFVRVGQEIELPRIETTTPQAKIHGRVITTRIVGVSFENRQETIAKLHEGDRLWLEREPENRFDSNAIKVLRNNSEQIGFLNRFLAQAIAPYLDALGHPLRAKVLHLTGSSYDGYSLGAAIQFKLPSQNQMRNARQRLVSLDWDE